MSPAGKVVALTVGAALVGAGAIAWCARWGQPHSPFPVRWWLLAVAFFLSDLLVVHLEMRTEAHSFTLSELALVIGLFFTSPLGIVAARFVGEGAYLAIRRRQAPLKLFLNLSVFVLETSVAVLVFRGLTPDVASPLDARTWLPMILAVAVADLVSALCISAAIHWHGGTSRPREVLTTSSITAAVNISLAMWASMVLWVQVEAVTFMAVVALVVGLAVKWYTDLNQRYASLQLLYDFTNSLGGTPHAQAVIEKALAEARRLLRAGVAEIVIVDRTTRQPVMRFRSSDDGGAASGVTRCTPEATNPVCEVVLRQGRSLVIGRGARKPAEVAMKDALGAQDFIVSPLRADDCLIGTIMVANRLGDVSSFDQQDCRLLETLANHASVAFENERLVEQLRREVDERRHEALHDPLTGLPNRSLFIDRLTAELSQTGSGRHRAVLLMDLDRFKEVNDTLGHQHGDAVLREVSRRLRATVRGLDTVARLGGDEFAVMVPDIAGAEQVEELARRIAEALSKPFTVEELTLEVSGSIGIAVAPEHGDDAVTLIQRADVAMYEAKSTRRSIAVYSPDRDTNSPRRLALAGELREAIARGEIVIHHQPKARLSDGQVVGTEALVRWNHPTHGLLMPDEFIPVAEQSGLISVLTVHVLRSALRHCRRWRQAGHDIGVAVNLAMRSLLDTELFALVGSALSEFGLPADCLTLELTESTVMADPVRTITVLQRLADIGVRISVDDFGTGYSSFAYLQRLPVHEVKVDRSFVRHMASDGGKATIVQSIVELGHNLGLSVVAEGVEDQETWDGLRLLGCDVVQGYFVTRPRGIDDVLRWLDARSASVVRESNVVPIGSLGPTAARPQRHARWVSL